MTQRTGIPFAAALALAIANAGGEQPPGDWPEWGGTPSKNMVSPAKGLPVSAETGEAKDGSDEIDPATTKNVKWVARLGDQTYGNPTVAGGRVYVGTNNAAPRDPRFTGDYGVLMCLDEATGKLAWQLVCPKLGAGRAQDFESVGMCSSPAVDAKAKRVYVVTNRCEVLCLDANGQADGNAGPFTDEGAYFAGPGKPPVEVTKGDADIVWRFDMRDELGAFPHQMASSAPLLLRREVLFVTTSNGVDWTGRHIPSPSTPALVCIDARTGALLAEEREGISARTFKCNWSSPAFGVLAEQAGRRPTKHTVVFGGGDGWVYGFDAETVAEPNAPGGPSLRLRWKFDANPAAYRSKDGKPLKYGSSKGPSEVLATAVVAGGRIYAAIGQEPESGDGVGCFNCFDPAAGAVRWRYDKIGRSMSTASVLDGLAYVADRSGKVHCVDADTGEPVWVHNLKSAVWGSTLAGHGKLYVGTEEGFVTVLKAGRDKEVLGEIEFPGPVYSTPVAANGVLYVATEKYLFALHEAGGER